MVIVPDGDMLVDEGHEIGVFNEDRQLQTGLRFNYNTMVFIPEPLRNHNVWIHDVGLGIRSTPDRVIVIRDSEAFDSSDEDASVYIQEVHIGWVHSL